MFRLTVIVRLEDYRFMPTVLSVQCGIHSRGIASIVVILRVRSREYDCTD